MTNLARKLYTEEEYLELERNAETKSEFFAGEIFAMSGANRSHNIISGNILGEFHILFKNKPCNVYGSDMRVRVNSNGLYTYPDITIVCGEEKFLDESEDTLLNPKIIFEVLSDSTEKYDRGKKFELYRELTSLEEYVLVSSKYKKIEKFKRIENGKWELTESQEGKDFKIESIDVMLSLNDIYAKVEFENK
jgi:Uma2 family endonuclease